MTVSELIQLLEREQATHGDLKIEIYDRYGDSFTPASLEVVARPVYGDPKQEIAYLSYKKPKS